MTHPVPLSAVALSLCAGSILGVQAQTIEPATAAKPGEFTRIGLINRLDLKSCRPIESETVHAFVSMEGSNVEIRREPVLLTQGACVAVPLLGHAIYFRSRSGSTGQASITVEFRRAEAGEVERYQFPVRVE